LDMDLMDDYTPESHIHITVPPGYRVVQAKGIPREQMPLLLLRAKVVTTRRMHVYVYRLSWVCANSCVMLMCL
jgi:hypothetical protein